jgi:alanine dehydrogenase
VETARECLEGADIMVEATRLTEPAVLLETGWVRPGAFVVPYGTVSAVGLDVLDVMDKVVVDDWGQAHAGPFGALRRHVDTGRLTAETLHAELGDVVAGRAPGRESDAERILFWHRGLATTDLAVAHLLVQRAQDSGVGTLVDYR